MKLMKYAPQLMRLLRKQGRGGRHHRPGNRYHHTGGRYHHPGGRRRRHGGRIMGIPFCPRIGGRGPVQMLIRMFTQSGHHGGAGRRW